MVIMGIDLGKARTGVAVSDEGEKMAFPREVIFERNDHRLVEKISDLAEKNGVGIIVVGLPKNMDGSSGSRAEECAAIGRMIGEATSKEVVMWDERCTTISAARALNDIDVRGKKRKNTIDAAAAAVILQDYLDFRRNTK